MPLVPMRAILEATEKYNYAQGAFNVNAVAQAKAVIEVHEMFRSAAIIQGADLANAFMGGRTDFANGTLEDKKIGANNIANAVKKYGENSSIPVALHLDHGKSIEACLAAMDGGYTSVMIDGSHLPFEDNIALTREVVKQSVDSLGVHNTGLCQDAHLVIALFAVTDDGVVHIHSLHGGDRTVGGESTEVTAHSGVHPVHTLAANLDGAVLTAGSHCIQQVCLREVLNELHFGSIVLLQSFLGVLDDVSTPLIQGCDAVDAAQANRHVKTLQVQKNMFHHITSIRCRFV